MIGVFITARLGSTRLSEKHLIKVNEKPIIWYLIERFLIGFKEEIESREGPGAVDGEQGYINAMVALRKWALGMKSVFAKKGIVVELVEPGLIDTAMARREFSHFPIVWDDIIKPEAYARSVFGYEHAADVEK